MNVLSHAPYGYRYIRKTEQTDAHFEVVESEAAIVRELFERYTAQSQSIGAITGELNRRGIPTRSGKAPWDRSTLWSMLRNPAYAGRAAWGKTRVAVRQRIIKPARAKGGICSRYGSRADQPEGEWIEIPVPALVSPETFALAQARLAENQRLSARRTKIPTLLQGLLVCAQCGYALCRVGKAPRFQYRCLGSIAYRHPPGPLCTAVSLRQDELDALIWEEVLRLLHPPELVRQEIERRLQESRNSDPAQQRKAALEQELKRVSGQLDKLLDTYQEELLSLEQLRLRAPELCRRQATLEKELQGVALQALENQRLNELSLSAEKFLSTLDQSVRTLDVVERRKVLRLIIKEILVHPDKLVIRHCLPLSRDSGGGGDRAAPLDRLCTRRPLGPPAGSAGLQPAYGAGPSGNPLGAAGPKPAASRRSHKCRPESGLLAGCA